MSRRWISTGRGTGHWEGSDAEPMPEVVFVDGLDTQDGIYVDGELKCKGAGLTPYEALLSLAGIVTVSRRDALVAPLPRKLEAR